MMLNESTIATVSMSETSGSSCPKMPNLISINGARL